IWATPGNAADHRQAELLAQRILELDAARSAGHELEHAFLLQGAQVVLCRVGRLETQRPCNLRARGRHAAFGNEVLDHPEDLGLPGRELVHGRFLYEFTVTVSIASPRRL